MRRLRDLWIPLGLLIVSFLLAGRLSPHFLDIRYLLDTSTLYVEAGLLALAMTLIITSGNIDLSVGSSIVLAACISAKLQAGGMPLAGAILVALCVGVGVGVMNGLLVAKLKLPSFLVTLGTMATARGAAQAMLGPSSVKLPSIFTGLDQALIAGVPWPLVIFLVIAIAFGIVLHTTVFGRWVTAVGTNESAARYSGLPVDRTKITVFALAGLAAGIGALLVNSRLGVARHDLVRGIELDAITIAVVGGTSIRGGKGSILGTVLAFFTIMVLKTGMGVANVKPEYQLTAIGALLVLAVAIQSIKFKR